LSVVSGPLSVVGEFRFPLSGRLRFRLLDTAPRFL
jgi:hypothetical protein